MMAGRALLPIGRFTQRIIYVRSASTDVAQLSQALKDQHYPKIGNRDIVGYGWNGYPSYMDRTEFPFPAVRFKENSADVLALRTKEKGDWKTLSVDDKKALYRSSFRETFAEMNAPTGEWKAILAFVFFAIAATGLTFSLVKHYVLPPMPETITREWQEAQLERMIRQRQGPVDGISSNWDYEKNDWK